MQTFYWKSDNGYYKGFAYGKMIATMSREISGRRFIYRWRLVGGNGADHQGESYRLVDAKNRAQAAYTDLAIMRRLPAVTPDPEPSRPAPAPKAAPKKTNHRIIATTANLPDDIHKQVRVALIYADKTLNQLINELVVEWLAKQPKR